MKSDQEIREIAQVLRNPALPESALLLILRGLESDGIAEGSNGAVRSLADTVRAAAEMDTGHLDLPRLEEAVRWWLGSRGYRLPRPQGETTGSQTAVQEFPLPRRKEWQDGEEYGGSDRAPSAGISDA